MFAASLAIGLAACEPQTEIPPTPEAPTLEAPPRSCQTRGEPAHRARYCEAQARARMARYAFDPSQGSDALVWLVEAVACYASANRTEAHARAQETLSSWQTHLSRDLRLRRLRLDHALSRDGKRQARVEVRFLLALLEKQPSDPYVRWLERLERTLP